MPCRYCSLRAAPELIAGLIAISSSRINSLARSLIRPPHPSLLSSTVPQSILDANETYAAAFAQSDPALLKKLAQGQSPKIFWLGCSDSRVSAELCVDLQPSGREDCGLTFHTPNQVDRRRSRLHLCARKYNPPPPPLAPRGKSPVLVSDLAWLNRGLIKQPGSHSATLLNASTPVTRPHPPPSPTQSTFSKSNPSSSAVRVPSFPLLRQWLCQTDDRDACRAHGLWRCQGWDASRRRCQGQGGRGRDR